MSPSKNSLKNTMLGSTFFIYFNAIINKTKIYLPFLLDLPFLVKDDHPAVQVGP